MDHMDYERSSTTSWRVAPRSCSTRSSPGPHAVPRAAAQRRLHEAGGHRRLHVLRRELPEPRAGRARRGPVRLPRLLPGRRRSVQRRAARPVRRAAIPGSAKFTAGSACSGMYRGAEALGGGRQRGGLAGAGRRDRGAGSRAASPQGPGGPAEMVPGQHHVRMNMYIAQSKGGMFKVVKNLGVIDPKECEVGRRPRPNERELRPDHLAGPRSGDGGNRTHVRGRVRRQLLRA